jgi:nucleotide-binding universal stress UspA family protein
MFKTLVVAVDPCGGGDSALRVAQSLARGASVDVNLVTVCDPAAPTADAACELWRRATLHGLDPHSWTIVRDTDVAGALLEHVARRHDALLVMATSQRSLSVSTIEHSVARDVVRRTDRPVLIVGPSVPADVAMTSTTPVLCVERSDLARRTVPVLVEWYASFVSTTPLIVEVVRPNADDGPARQRLAELAALLAGHHVHASTTLAVADDVVAALDDVAAGLVGAVCVATSDRYPDGHLHLFSSTQRLVQHARCPVLVVPAVPASSRFAQLDAATHGGGSEVTTPTAAPAV